jgi:hypothetical protein
VDVRVRRLVSGGGMVLCPLCCEPMTLHKLATVEQDGQAVVVVTEAGSMWPHVRDAHPERFELACGHRRRMNAQFAEVMGAAPRKIDGTLLLEGEDVGDVTEELGSGCGSDGNP